MIKYCCDCCEVEIPESVGWLQAETSVTDPRNEYSSNTMMITRMICRKCAVKLENALKELKFRV